MLLFTILVLILTILTILFVLGISIFGSSIIIIFGDVIVCGFLIVLIIRALIKKKKG